MNDNSARYSNVSLIRTFCGLFSQRKRWCFTIHTFTERALFLIPGRYTWLVTMEKLQPKEALWLARVEAVLEDDQLHLTPF